MRTALVAALRHSSDGTLRAGLSLAGRTVLARQVDLLRELGCERILCLCEKVDAVVLQVQADVEASGGTFEALSGFLRLPALVRAEDELVILADGILPDLAPAHALFSAPPLRFVAALPPTSPLVMRYPQDFERIDAEHHWAGLLAMRGAPVQHLADFPPDSDAISLLLRLALQAGTPFRELPATADAPGQWLLADDSAMVAEQERALIIAATGSSDWRAPATALARIAARRTPPQALEQRSLVAACCGALLLVAGAGLAGWGTPAWGMALASGGALAMTFAGALGRLRQRLVGKRSGFVTGERAGVAIDILAALAVLLALAPWPQAEPLAVLGPVTIGLARLLNRWAPSSRLGPLAERPVLLTLFALAAGFGLLAKATALVALFLLFGLLLRGERN
ncbi:hypothetical protein [Erythrobacter dokdonensis]|uniref:Uncharacterized protein n=1 Tax=Erythrobacter dokdonensis DSW-74 TaxID=1300349 RepID=A0A1A7BJ80_9SPHN|nr:hypothetical protein [Erythrobacter dokdonensis]OBV12529.1 hypothetical protein I603_0660 [Erythrobacter dokdonensis DSW-74]